MVSCLTGSGGEMIRQLARYAARRLEQAAQLMHAQSEHEGAFPACILPECASLKGQIQQIQKESR